MRPARNVLWLPDCRKSLNVQPRYAWIGSKLFTTTPVTNDVASLSSARESMISPKSCSFSSLASKYTLAWRARTPSLSLKVAGNCGSRVS